jgi:hypothetical protein
MSEVILIKKSDLEEFPFGILKNSLCKFTLLKIFLNHLEHYKEKRKFFIKSYGVALKSISDLPLFLDRSSQYLKVKFLHYKLHCLYCIILFLHGLFLALNQKLLCQIERFWFFFIGNHLSGTTHLWMILHISNLFKSSMACPNNIFWILPKV